MRISTKGRYGVAVMTALAERAREQATASDIAAKLGLSKIYLEQVLTMLKRADLVQSVKGSQGGYFISVPVDRITVFDVLQATENGLFERTEAASDLDSASPSIENAVKSTVWDPLDAAVAGFLKKISLRTILDRLGSTDYMFYI